MSHKPMHPDLMNMFKGVIQYKKKYAGQFIVVKFGGALAADPEVITHIAEQASFLQHSFDAHIVLVHGGGIQIDNALKREKITPQKDNAGLRITDLATLKTSDAALRALNGEVVSIFNAAAPDIKAVGMSGYDAQIISASPTSDDPENYTGHIQKIDTDYLKHVMSFGRGDVIPVIYPICHNPGVEEGENRLNVNADEVASKLAAELGAKRLILCSDVTGVLDHERNLIPHMSIDEVDQKIAEGVITGGMIQKVRCAAHAAELIPSGAVVILDGRNETSVITEFLHPDGSGTLVSTPTH